MKIKSFLSAVSFAGCACLNAAPLASSTAVQSAPDVASPVITVLRAGTEAPVPSDKAGPVPDGWSAVAVQGPFEGYVRNKDLTKQLDVAPGASVYMGPKDDAGVLTVFDKGDKAEITGLHGAWTQVRLEKTLIGYIHNGATAAAPVASAMPVAAPVPMAPSAPASMPQASADVPATVGGDVGLSRIFEGTLTGSRSLLGPKKPYKWQLVDASGAQIAYVDISKLLLTDQIENYLGHSVVVLGSIGPVAGSSDIVIMVEALRLK